MLQINFLAVIFKLALSSIIKGLVPLNSKITGIILLAAFSYNICPTFVFPVKNKKSIFCVSQSLSTVSLPPRNTLTCFGLNNFSQIFLINSDEW
ncbi:Uncharacterised protein, partial [Mycoplasmopsis synoviae]